jgi:hypothetical protein
MTVLVDPPPHDRAGQRPGSTVTAPLQPAPKLAEPPITGGKVEELMGRLIKVLAHSPLARPVPAVTLSVLGLLGVAFVGLCATAPNPSAATLPVKLPLTDLATRAGFPRLGDDPANVIMYVSTGLCALGLAMMLWANSQGWSPSPRKVFAAAAGAVAVLVNITPVGSADIASYAAYGRIAALGQNPYVATPINLPGNVSGDKTTHLYGMVVHNPYTAIVNPMWRDTPSVYGPIGTWIHLLGALIGGPRPWLTIWALMIMTGIGFLATGYVLMRTAENPVRASLMWVANPLLIVVLVLGGHLDVFLALTTIAAIVVSRRGRTAGNDVLTGLLVGVACGIKVNAVYAALAIAIPLIHDRDWKRLARTMSVAAVTTAALYYFSWGFGALKPLSQASRMVISPNIWRVVQWSAFHLGARTAKPYDPAGLHVQAMVTTVIGFAWPPLMLAIAWYLYNRLSPDVPTVVAATCALTFGWVIAESWSLPWYSAIAWVTLALLPRNSLTRWLTLATAVLALLHFNGGWPRNMEKMLLLQLQQEQLSSTPTP